MIIRSVLFTLLVLVLGSCLPARRERPSIQPLPYSLVSSSPLFSKKHVQLSIDSGDQSILVKMSLKDMEKFPFPVHPVRKDSLFETAFRFDFYENGKPIRSDHMLKHDGQTPHDSIPPSRDLCQVSDTSDIRYGKEYEFRVPFYAFHELRHGKHNIEMRISQSVFKKEIMYKNGEETVYTDIYAEKPLLNASVKFDILVPSIYKSFIYGLGFKLKNDSTFSPVGMDNTIWKSSYPDLYWAVFYPEDEFYCQSDYQTSTDSYEGKDTFCLLHYSMNDSLGISVYDHDNLSRDDGLGYWKGELKFLEREPLRRISFGNVKYFDVKLRRVGAVN